MGPEKNKGSEEREIICPCGRSFKRAGMADGGEVPCPACGRVHVLPGMNGNNAVSTGKRGDTTVHTAQDQPLIKKGELMGPYRITGFVGEGGMGSVYSAVDTSLQREVAIKVLSRQLLSKKDFVTRFSREARAIARLNHPNIVQIYYTGDHDGLPYYAMEMISGGSLDELKGDKKITPDLAVELMLQSAKGLSAAFDGGVIHRDIKPSNLMLDNTGRLKITDFGLAKTVEVDSSITHTGTIIGTPYYMSPEQGEGRGMDERADIYSLGATFYHLLTGSPPFEADSPIGIILKHVNDKLPSLVQKNSEVPEPLAAVIETMMAKDPANRHESYASLINELESLCSGSTPGAAQGKKTKRPGGFRVLHGEPGREADPVALKHSGIVRRLMALAIDHAILLFMCVLYARAYGAPSIESLFRSEALPGVTFLILSFLYFFLGDARGGMTLGKILLRCRLGVKDASMIGFKRSTIRTILLFSVFVSIGAVALDSPLSGLLGIYCQAAAGLGMPTSGTFMNICLVWLFINFVCFLIMQGEGTLHDLVSGAHIFVRVAGRDAHAAAYKGRPVSGTANEQKSGRAGEATYTGASKPPPIPRDASSIRNTAGFHAQRKAATAGDGYLSRKSPILAAVLSVFPGLGQLYNGDIMKGFLIFTTCWLIFPWIIGIFDAYFKATIINRRVDILP